MGLYTPGRTGQGLRLFLALLMLMYVALIQGLCKKVFHVKSMWGPILYLPMY